MRNTARSGAFKRTNYQHKKMHNIVAGAGAGALAGCIGGGQSREPNHFAVTLAGALGLALSPTFRMYAMLGWLVESLGGTLMVCTIYNMCVDLLTTKTLRGNRSCV